MESKKKAEELVNRFISGGCLFSNAIKCAKTTVDEILEVLGDIYETIDERKYWNEVKQHLNEML